MKRISAQMTGSGDERPAVQSESDTMNRTGTPMETPTVPMDILLVEDQEEEISRVEEAVNECELQNRMIVMKNTLDALVYLRQTASGEEFYSDTDDHHPPGLILLDANMAGKRGFDFLHDIRCDPKLMTIPIIILTNSLEETDLACSMAHGVTGYFLKPMDANQLKKVVSDVEEHWSLLSISPCAN